MKHKTSCTIIASLWVISLGAQDKNVKAVAPAVKESAAIPAEKALAIQLARSDQQLVVNKIAPLLAIIKDLDAKIVALGNELSAESSARGQKVSEEVCALVGLKPEDVASGKCLLSSDMKTVSRKPDDKK